MKDNAEMKKFHTIGQRKKRGNPLEIYFNSTIFIKFVILRSQISQDQCILSGLKSKNQIIECVYKDIAEIFNFFFFPIARIKKSITFAASKNDMVRSSRG